MYAANDSVSSIFLEAYQAAQSFVERDRAAV